MPQASSNSNQNTSTTVNSSSSVRMTHPVSVACTPASCVDPSNTRKHVKLFEINPVSTDTILTSTPVWDTSYHPKQATKEQAKNNHGSECKTLTDSPILSLNKPLNEMNIALSSAYYKLETKDAPKLGPHESLKPVDVLTVHSDRMLNNDSSSATTITDKNEHFLDTDSKNEQKQNILKTSNAASNHDNTECKSEESCNILETNTFKSLEHTFNDFYAAMNTKLMKRQEEYGVLSKQYDDLVKAQVEQKAKCKAERATLETMRAELKAKEAELEGEERKVETIIENQTSVYDELQRVRTDEQEIIENYRRETSRLRETYKIKLVASKDPDSTIFLKSHPHKCQDEHLKDGLRLDTPKQEAHLLVCKKSMRPASPTSFTRRSDDREKDQITKLKAEINISRVESNYKNSQSALLHLHKKNELNTKTKQKSKKENVSLKYHKYKKAAETSKTTPDDLDDMPPLAHVDMMTTAYYQSCNLEPQNVAIPHPVNLPHMRTGDDSNLPHNIFTLEQEKVRYLIQNNPGSNHVSSHQAPQEVVHHSEKNVHPLNNPPQHRLFLDDFKQHMSDRTAKTDIYQPPFYPHSIVNNSTVNQMKSKTINQKYTRQNEIPYNILVEVSQSQPVVRQIAESNQPHPTMLKGSSMHVSGQHTALLRSMEPLERHCAHVSCKPEEISSMSKLQDTSLKRSYIDKSNRTVEKMQQHLPANNIPRYIPSQVRENEGPSYGRNCGTLANKTPQMQVSRQKKSQQKVKQKHQHRNMQLQKSLLSQKVKQRLRRLHQQQQQQQQQQQLQKQQQQMQQVTEKQLGVQQHSHGQHRVPARGVQQAPPKLRYQLLVHAYRN